MRYFLLTFVLLTGCSSYYANWWEVENEPIEPEIYCFSDVIIPYAVELAHTKRLRFEDARIYYDDFVARFRVVFTTQHILELCPTRELLVDVVEGLLIRLNGHPKAEAAFGHYPITATDLEIYFDYESYFVEYVDPTYIAWVYLHDGIVRYYSGVIKDWHKDFWNERIETYSQSFEFVQLERLAKKRLGYDKPRNAAENIANILNEPVPAPTETQQRTTTPPFNPAASVQSNNPVPPPPPKPTP